MRLKIGTFVQIFLFQNSETYDSKSYAEKLNKFYEWLPDLINNQVDNDENYVVCTYVCGRTWWKGKSYQQTLQ